MEDSISKKDHKVVRITAETKVFISAVSSEDINKRIKDDSPSKIKRDVPKSK